LHAKIREEKIAFWWNIFGLFHHRSSAATTTSINTGVGSKVALALIHVLGTTISGGESTTAITAFTSLAATIKTVGTVLVIGGIILDVVTVGYAAH